MKFQKNENVFSNGSFTSTNYKSQGTKLNRSNSAISVYTKKKQNTFNTKTHIACKQSPKISSTKKRYDSQPVLFSLLDVNDRITNKRGTDLPAQFKRAEENKPKRNIQTAFPSTRSERLFKPYVIESNEYEKCNKVTKDVLKPKYYNIYETITKNALRCKSSVSRKDLTLNQDEMRKKMYDSDIFFQRVIKSNTNRPSSNYSNFQHSDIFNLKNDSLSLSKSGEKSFLRPKPQYKYTVSRESNSQWHPKHSMPTLLNYSSSERHLLNPAIKNIGNTKQDLQKKYSEVMYDYKSLCHRQKSLCEFIDLSRVSAPHLNKDYLDMYSKDNKIFKKRSEICSDYYDIYGCYKNLCDKPFQPFKVITGSV